MMTSKSVVSNMEKKEYSEKGHSCVFAVSRGCLISISALHRRARTIHGRRQVVTYKESTCHIKSFRVFRNFTLIFLCAKVQALCRNCWLIFVCSASTEMREQFLPCCCINTSSGNEFVVPFLSSRNGYLAARSVERRWKWHFCVFFLCFRFFIFFSAKKTILPNWASLIY